MSSGEVLALYKTVLRISKELPNGQIGRKLRSNARELILLRRKETDKGKIQQYINEGHEILYGFSYLIQDNQFLEAIGRKPKKSG